MASVLESGGRYDVVATPAPDVLEQASTDAQDADFLAFVNAWVEITALLNEMSRSMGQHDFYPFVLSRPAVRKLHFVHRVVIGSAGTGASILAK